MVAANSVDNIGPMDCFPKRRPAMQLTAGSGHLQSDCQGRLSPRCVNSCTLRRKSVVRHFHLGHSTNTVAANYGSGYALQVTREALVRVWEE